MSGLALIAGLLARLRDAAASIPIPVAKGLFAGLYVIIAIWIVTIPRSEVRDPDRPRILNDLRLWAVAAIGVQIAIYLLL
ncbi:MAG: hypothetical protein JXP34_24230 [Planctomycetes bacterium]|nr:hypothetical protein [Planctomycetota bacterium]